MEYYEVGPILNDFEYSLGKLSDSSKYVYMSCIKSFLTKGYDIRRPQHYYKFLIKHTVDKRSTHYYDVLIKFVKWYFSEENDKQLKKDIIYTIKSVGKITKDPKKQVVPLKKTQRLNIINNMKSSKHRIIGWIQEDTGVRAGDVLRLKRNNKSNDTDIKYAVYQGSEGTQLIFQCYFTQKGDKRKVVPIFDKELIKEIEHYLREVYLDDTYLFCDRKVVHKDNRNNNYIVEKRNYYLYWKDLRDTCIRLGVDPKEFSTHDIRRNFAIDSWIKVLDKKDIKTLQEMMGHSRAETTMRYLKGSGLDRDDMFARKARLNK